MRILFSAGIPCQADCKYCFAKWKDKYSSFPQLEGACPDEKEAIIYPCCDGEFFDQHNLIDYVRTAAQRMDKVYLSLSTKQNISNDAIDCIEELNHELMSSNKGFVKFAISISSISMLEDIEQGTMSYNDRLNLAKKIYRTDMVFSITIKPVLPFVQAEEYCQIIHDFSEYTKHVLIGGLYVNPTSAFYSQYIASQFNAKPRTVEWISGHPMWDYVEDDTQFKIIRDYASKNNILLFDSDIDLINSLINRGDD